MGLREPQFLLVFSWLTRKNKWQWLDSFTAHCPSVSSQGSRNFWHSLLDFVVCFEPPAVTVNRGRCTFSIPPSMVLQNQRQIMIDNSNQPRKDGGMWMIPIYIYYRLSKSLLGNEKKNIFNISISDDCRMAESCNKHSQGSLLCFLISLHRQLV